MDVVVVTDGRKSGPVIGRRSIARSRGKAIAEKVGDQYEVFFRIQGQAGADHWLIGLMLGAEERRKDDDIVFTRVQAAISLVGQSGSSERQARLKDDIS